MATSRRCQPRRAAGVTRRCSRRGHALIDRALYLPKSWIGDQQRCRQAGIPEEASFATKPTLATAMITAAVEAGVPASWVAGDEVYGADPNLRAQIRHAGLGYVLQVAANRRMPTSAGPVRVDELATLVPERGWQKASAGTGSKGERFYSWAWIVINDEPEYEPPDEVSRTGQHHLLIRRNDATGELAYHRCYTPRPVPLSTLVRVAGQRWRVEESFQACKGLTGLDQHQVRRWTSWHRWTTLAMLAHAFLAVTTADEREDAPTPAGLIPLTVNEFRRLFDALLLGPIRTLTSLLNWSTWRRKHQARARESHYRRREHNHNDLRLSY